MGGHLPPSTSTRTCEADFILANPPFNMSDWARKADDPRWRYGVPPAGNANYAWLQHIVYQAGAARHRWRRAGQRIHVVEAVGEGEIRAAMVEADLVACMIALPPQLFRTTQIPACLWFFAKDKIRRARKRLDRPTRRGAVHRRPRPWAHGRPHRARPDHGGHREDRRHVPRLARHRPLGEPVKYEDVARLLLLRSPWTRSASHDHVLTPGRYVGAAEIDDGDDEPIAEKIERLTKELFAQLRRVRASGAGRPRSTRERLDA